MNARVCEMCMHVCVRVCNTSESSDLAVEPEGVHREAAAMSVAPATGVNV